MPKSVRYLAYVIYMLNFCLPQLTVHLNRELRYRISSTTTHGFDILYEMPQLSASIPQRLIRKQP